MIPTSMVLLLFGLAGALLAAVRIINKILRKRRLSPPEALLLYFIFAYWFGTAAFYILARFRLPVFPLLAIFAGGFFHHSKRLLFRERKLGGKAAALAVCALLFSGAVVFAGYNVYRTHFEASLMRFARPNGTVSCLNENTWLLKDNGPATFGGWTPLKVASGMSLEKTFSIPPELVVFDETTSNAKKRKSVAKPRSTIFRLSLVWSSPSVAQVSVNGKMFLLKSPSTQQSEIREFAIPFPENGIVKLLFGGVEGNLYLFVDSQRNYSRTKLKGEILGAELVSDILVKIVETKK